METKWIPAQEWPDLARSMTEEGWWLADLCGVDRLNLTHGNHGEAHRPGVGGDETEANENGQGARGEGQARAEGDEDSPIRGGVGPQSGNGGSPSGSMRFEIVAHWLHRERRQRSRVHVLADGDPPRVPSITRLWPTADFMEREAFDLVGIVFDGHPNLKRIMLPDEWEGHPLRKDYGVGKIPIEFVPQPFLQFDSPHQQPNSPEAGVTVDRLGQSEVDAGRASGGMSHFADTKINSQTEDGDPA